MNPLLLLGLCSLIFAAGIVVGIMFMPGVQARDSERIDFLETATRAAYQVEIRTGADGDAFGLYVQGTIASVVKWRPTLRGAIDAHRTGEPAVVEEAPRVIQTDLRKAVPPFSARPS